MDLTERVMSGDRLALARLLTKIENEDPDGLTALSKLYPQTGRAHRVGITGAPGTGKSTLVNQLALHFRKGETREASSSSEPPRVGVVAVDPSSPFSGGALLGDRIRMRDLAGDAGVFIRSMATRGALGGIARATADMVDVLDAAGYEVIFIETVGAGQAEVEIARTAHTTVVVDAPGLGDDVQAVKAGILEIADVLVVNKADQPSAQNTLRALRAALALSPSKGLAPITARTSETQDEGAPEWSVPVMPTVATTGEGVPVLVDAIRAHAEYLGASGKRRARERARVRSEMENLLREHLLQEFMRRHPDKGFEQALQRALKREVAPRQAVIDLLKGE